MFAIAASAVMSCEKRTTLQESNGADITAATGIAVLDDDLRLLVRVASEHVEGTYGFLDLAELFELAAQSLVVRVPGEATAVKPPPPSWVSDARPPRGDHAKPLFVHFSHVANTMSGVGGDAYPMNRQRRTIKPPQGRRRFSPPPRKRAWSA